MVNQSLSLREPVMDGVNSNRKKVKLYPKEGNTEFQKPTRKGKGSLEAGRKRSCDVEK